MSLLGYTYQCALKHTDIKLETLQNKDMILLIENNIRGGISSVMGDRYVKSDENKKNIIHGCYKFIWSLNESTFTL